MSLRGRGMCHGLVARAGDRVAGNDRVHGDGQAGDDIPTGSGVQSQPEFLPILLRRVDPQQKTQLLAWTLSTDGQKIVDKLSNGGLEHYADAVLVKAAALERPQHVIASHIVTLCDNGHSHAVNALLDKTLAAQSRKEVQELVNVLRQQNHLATLAAIASWIKDTTDDESSSNYALLRVGLREYVDDRRQRR